MFKYLKVSIPSHFHSRIAKYLTVFPQLRHLFSVPTDGNDSQEKVRYSTIVGKLPRDQSYKVNVLLLMCVGS